MRSDGLLGRHRVSRRLAAAIGLVTLSAAVSLAALVATAQATLDLAHTAAEWNEHAAAVQEVNLAALAVLRAVERRVAAGAGAGPAFDPALERLRAASRRSRAMAEAFDPDEQAEENELALLVERYLELAGAVVAQPSEERMNGLRDAFAELAEQTAARARGEFAGALASAQALERGTKRLLMTSFGVSSLLMLAALALSLTLVRRLRDALGRLAYGAQRVTAGEFDYRTRLDSPDELGVVCVAFDAMAARIEADVAKIRERTAEAEATREDLRARLTELSHAQAKLVASERLAAVGMLSAGVAHEINNPLAFVMTNVEYVGEVLKEKASVLPDLGEALAALTEARSGAERVRDIVRDLKAFARTGDDHRYDLDLTTVIDSTLRLAWNEIRHRARLVRDFQPVPSVRASEGRLGQVLVNLVMNAVQALPEREASQNVLTVRTRVSPTGQALVEIEDNGVGMPPEVQARLFEPFFTTKPRGQGTGLGLSISKGIIEAAGGVLSVTSQPGAGTTVRVALPPAAGAGPARGPASSGPRLASPRRTLRVLVVDDEALVGSAVRRALGEHAVEAVTSAHLALARLKDGATFDVIICDLMMPAMSGAEFCERLAREHPEAHARVLLLTGGAFTAEGQALVDEGGLPCMLKPFTGSELRALVERLGNEAARPLKRVPAVTAAVG